MSLIAMRNKEGMQVKQYQLSSFREKKNKSLAAILYSSVEDLWSAFGQEQV